MKKFRPIDIEKANQVSIIDYMEKTGIGDIIYHSHNWYKVAINGHDSIVVSKRQNYFVHNGNYRDKLASGGIINFIRYFEQKSFPEAIKTLLGDQYVLIDDTKKKKDPFYYDDTQEVDNVDKARRYLRDVRKIDNRIIDYLVEHQFLAQNKFGAAVFKWYLTGKANMAVLPGLQDFYDNDEFSDTVIGATIQGTIYNVQKYGKRGTFKQIVKNSEDHYGFNITLGNPKAVYLFESPIDLLSYWTLHYDTLSNCRLFSMEGLKKGVRERIRFEADVYFNHETIEEFLCVDNDNAATEFLKTIGYQKAYGTYSSLEDEYDVTVKTTILPPLRQYKDYNEQLVKQSETFQFYLDSHSNHNQVKDFLVKTHFINEKLVDTLFAKQFLIEDNLHRAVFVWRRHGIAVGGQTHSIHYDTKAYGKDGYSQTVMTESNQNASFSLVFGKDPKRLFVFQNPIDLLSFYTLFQDKIKKSKQSMILMSLNPTDMSKGVVHIVNKISHHMTPTITAVSLCFNKTAESERINDEIIQLSKSASHHHYALFSVDVKNNMPQRHRSWQDELKGLHTITGKVNQYEKNYQTPIQQEPNVSTELSTHSIKENVMS